MAEEPALSYVPLDGRAWRLAMGLRPLDDASWLEVDALRDVELKEKGRLLERHFEDVVALRSEAEEACGELLGEVSAFLHTYHPELPVAVPADEHPLVAAARMTQEDLCVMQRTEQWRLAAAVVCFPSRWRLAEKIGTTLDDIHAPVPGYDAALGAPTRRVFDRLGPERSFWRLNWTLLSAADLFQPAEPRGADATPVLDWSFRVERQTIRRLPVSGAIVFTIRTYVTPLRELLERDEMAGHLMSAVRSVPPANQAYKGWTDVAERLAEAMRT